MAGKRGMRNKRTWGGVGEERGKVRRIKREKIRMTNQCYAKRREKREEE